MLAVGRLQLQKGFDLLLQAWQSVLRQMPEARLRIVGGGPLGAELAALATTLGVAASVEFTAPTDRIEALYREAAVFVLSSRYEGMPLALLEAQALGVPAVAFDCPTGPREILSEATGVLVPCRATCRRWRRRCCACSAIRRCGRAWARRRSPATARSSAAPGRSAPGRPLIDEVATAAGPPATRY